MPFTPFHFGIGLGVKGATAPVFSWSAFCATQVVIDCETLYYLVRNEYPVHRFFHSFFGAGLVGLAVSAGCIAILPRLASGAALGGNRQMRFLLKGESSTLGIWLGGLLGGLSHPLLDGLVHRDVRPFAPWSPWNPFLDLVSLTTLQQVCLVAALGGALGMALWLRSTRYVGGEER